MDPFRLAEQVKKDYRSYISASFPIRDPKLKKLLDYKIDHEQLLWKGPYVGLSPEYRQGQKASDVRSSSDPAAGLDARVLGKFGSWNLYAHQAKAISRLIGPKPLSTLVATGTGSGKTEAFFIPLLDHCLRARDKGEKGVKALLLYPLTALTNDQFKRFKGYLDGTGVTLARYTAETPRDKSQRPKGLPDFVRGTREEIWADPPDILMCHPKMLEYLLTRPEDREKIFVGAPLRWLVVDEVHTSTGTFGAELALLIRRLRAATNRPGESDLVCVGTSATLQRNAAGQVPPDAYEKLARFGTNLFGCWFGGTEAEHRAAVVTEELAPLPEPVSSIPPPAVVAEEDLAVLYGDDDARAQDVAVRVLGGALPTGASLPQRLAAALERHPVVIWLRKALTQPRTVRELVDLWKVEVRERSGQEIGAAAREIEAWLLMGARAARASGNGEADRILGPRLHLFARGLQHVRRCTNPDCGALVERGQKACGACGSRSRPLKVCRHCGQDFFGLHAARDVSLKSTELVLFRDDGRDAVDDDEEDEPPSGPEAGEEDGERWKAGPVHMTWKLHELRGAVAVDVPGGAEAPEDADEGEAEDPGQRRRIPMRPLWYCARCGAGRTAGGTGACTNPVCAGGPLYQAHAFSGKPITCPACGGRYGTKEVITPLATGAAAAVTTLTTSVLEHLERSQRKTLVFTDARQEAAFQAGYLEDKHAAFVLRQVVMRQLQQRQRMPLTHAARFVYEDMVARKMEDPPANKEEAQDRQNAITWELLVEFARRTNRRVNLEGVGLVRVEYEDLQKVPAKSSAAKDLCALLGIDEATCARLLGAFLDEMRTRRAVDHPFLQAYLSPENEIVRRLDLTVAQFEKRPIGYIDDVGPHPSKQDDPKPYARRGWWPSQGIPGVLERLVMSLRPQPKDEVGRKELRHIAHQAIQLAVRALREPGEGILPYITRNSIGSTKDKVEAWQVNHRRIVLFPVDDAGTHWCDTCRSVAGHPVGGKCPQHLCSGALALLKPDYHNYYVDKYARAEPIAIRTAEHSGQIGGQVREQIEKDFIDGKIQALACTPTMELGVDIGDLAALMLRNVPPLAANYAQRAGRAGRSGARVALVVTYCAITPHDQHFYDHPPDVIRGLIDPPRIAPDNPSLVARHARALTLEQVTTTKDKALSVPATLRRWLTGQPPSYALTGDGVLGATILAKAPDIVMRAKAVFEPDRKRLGMPWLDEVLEAEIPRTGEAMHSALQGAVDELNLLSVRLAELVALGPAALEGPLLREKRQLEARTLFLYGPERPADGPTARRSLYPLGFLGERGVLPGYALPGVQIRCFTDRTSDPLERGGEIGIAEYAPGNTIYVQGRKLAVTGLFGGFDPVASPGAANRAERGTEAYRTCKHCDVLVLRTDRGTCPQCEEELAPPERFTSLKNTRARVDVHITAREEVRAHDRYKIRYLLPDKDAQDCAYPHRLQDRAPFTIRHYGGVPVIVLNEGHRRADGSVVPFKVCPECGLAEQPFATDPARVEKQHAGSKCGGKFEKVCLAVRQDAEALVVSIPPSALKVRLDELELLGDDPEHARLAYGVDGAALVTLDPEVVGRGVLEALLAGAKTRLAAQENELRGFLAIVNGPRPEASAEGEPPPLKAVEVVLYDATPGGSGLIQRLAAKGEFEQVAAAGAARLEECTCHVLARACYGCLKRYGNQRSHDVLDRRVAIAFGKKLAHSLLIGEDDVKPGKPVSPVTKPVPVQAKVELDAGRKVMEKRYREAFLASGVPVRFEDSAGNVVVAGYPPGTDPATWPEGSILVEQHLVQLQGAHTVIDFAIPLKKYAIYCDGAAYHSPGDATKNWQRDLEIAALLQDEGWKVFRYTWMQLEEDEKLKAIVDRTKKAVLG